MIGIILLLIGGLALSALLVVVRSDFIAFLVSGFVSMRLKAASLPVGCFG